MKKIKNYYYVFSFATVATNTSIITNERAKNATKKHRIKLVRCRVRITVDPNI